MRQWELLLYRSVAGEPLFEKITGLLDRLSAGQGGCEDVAMTPFSDRMTRDDCRIFHEAMGELIDFGSRHGFYGNLWQDYIANLMVNSENAFSLASEIRTEVEGSLRKLAIHDFQILKSAFGADLLSLAGAFGAEDIVREICSFTPPKEAGRIYNTRIRDRIVEVAGKLGDAPASEYYPIMAEFYREYGVGRFGLHKAFRLEHEGQKVQIVPILNIKHVQLEDLVGYEDAKQKLVENTEAFVAGRAANNCLLYGEAGTGKSSSIKAICNRYYEKGLRIIEIYKHQFGDLNDVISQIKGRNYKFILYMDDLSFEDFEIEYKYLKAVIEGGLEKKPDNVLIYATSNRRHLVKETFKDREDAPEDIHKNDSVQEKLSLSSRFGVSIYFPAPMKKEYEHIVRELAARNHIVMPDSELMLKASQWELSHGGMSGRTAQQFIDDLLGKETP